MLWARQKVKPVKTIRSLDSNPWSTQDAVPLLDINNALMRAAGGNVEWCLDPPATWLHA